MVSVGEIALTLNPYFDSNQFGDFETIETINASIQEGRLRKGGMAPCRPRCVTTAIRIHQGDSWNNCV